MDVADSEEDIDMVLLDTKCHAEVEEGGANSGIDTVI